MRGESGAVAGLVAEGDVQMDYTNEHEEGWLHLAAKAHRGDHAICTSPISNETYDYEMHARTC